MSGKEKSTDPDLSAVQRKTLRAREAQEAVADHEQSRKSFQKNRERFG
jgi:hypothetical protein